MNLTDIVGAITLVALIIVAGGVEGGALDVTQGAVSTGVIFAGYMAAFAYERGL